MVGKRSPFTDQIWSYIKNRCILGIQAKDIFNEICRVYGNNELSFSSVTRWCKKFKSGVDSVKDAPHAHCPKTATSPKMVEKVKNLIATDARFTTRYIAKYVGISAGAAHWRGSEDPRLMECMELNVYGVALDIDRKEFKESAKAVSEFSLVAIFCSTC